MNARALGFISWVIVASVAAGCRSAQNSDEVGNSSNVASMTDILAPEIERAGLEGTTALAVIQKLRPAFLANSVGAGRHVGLSVTINGGTMNDISALDQVHASAIEAVRYFTATQAGLRFGFRAEGPVILLTLKSAQRP